MPASFSAILWPAGRGDDITFLKASVLWQPSVSIAIPFSRFFAVVITPVATPVLSIAMPIALVSYTGTDRIRGGVLRDDEEGLLFVDAGR